jgi:hypothetical protein
MRRVPLVGSLVAVALGGVIVLNPGFAVAQDELTGSPVAVDPAECVVEPRNLDELIEIWTSGDYVLDEEIAAGNFPTGTPADDATVAAIEEVARQLSACANAGDYLRMLALFTDEGVQYFGPESSTATEEDIRGFFAETPVEPLPEEEREAYYVTNVQVLDDGRIGGVLHQTAPEVRPPTYLIFKEVDGNFLIDFVVDVENTQASPEATPTS